MIRIENLEKSYKDKKVLDGINLSFQTGEHKIYGLIGPNGAGKTSLLKCIAGILEYSSGKILNEDKPVDGNWLRENIVFLATGERASVIEIRCVTM